MLAKPGLELIRSSQMNLGWYMRIFFLSILLTSNCFGLTKVILGASPALSSAGIYIAQEKGFFKDAGLEVEITVMPNSTSQMVTLLSNNKLQVAAGNVTAGLYNAFSSGEKFKIVADKGHTSNETPYLWLIVKKELVDSGKIKSLKDLKGKKIGLPSIDGSSQQIVLDKMLSSEGLTLKDVELVKVGYPEVNLGLKNDLIQAAIQLEPFLFTSTTENVAVKFASAQKFWPDQQSGVLIFSEEFAKQTVAAQSFMNAYLKGIAEYNLALNDKKRWLEVSGLINKYTKLDPEATWSKLEPTGLANSGQLNLISMQNDLNWYFENGFIKSKIDLKSVVESKFTDKVKK